jgi:acyl carrier protein
MFLQDFVQTPESSRERDSAFLEELRQAMPHERRTLVLAHVQSQVATVLDVSPPSRISADQGFFELGLDSLTSIELRNRLQNSFACRLPTTLVFDYPNLQAFVDYLCQRVIPLEFGTDPTAGTEIDSARAATDSPPEDARLDDLTAGELETMLDAKLAEIEEEVE